MSIDSVLQVSGGGSSALELTVVCTVCLCVCVCVFVCVCVCVCVCAGRGRSRTNHRARRELVPKLAVFIVGNGWVHEEASLRTRVIVAMRDAVLHMDTTTKMTPRTQHERVQRARHVNHAHMCDWATTALLVQWRVMLMVACAAVASRSDGVSEPGTGDRVARTSVPNNRRWQGGPTPIARWVSTCRGTSRFFGLCKRVSSSIVSARRR